MNVITVRRGTVDQQRVQCDNCHRTRFRAYRLPSGKVILVCYECGFQMEAEQQPS